MRDRSYDFIVVGGGSAGCVLAGRLSESGRHRVLLLEAGRRYHPLERVPISYSKFIDNPAVNWCFMSKPEESTAGRPIPVPRGRMLGGSSAINGLVFVRGQALDYDTWAQMGNRGWSYADVLPIFKRLESFDGGDDTLRGRDGPLRLTEAYDSSPLYDAWFAAGEEVGLARNPDYNGATQEGMCRTQTTIHDGWRMSTSRCYIDPARRRSNLHIQCNAQVESLLLEHKRCTGLRYRIGNEQREAHARCEIVLCAGSINSPQILELSGIGRPEVLRAQGIEVRHALDGVGENLRDHYVPRLRWDITRAGVTFNDRARGLGLAWQILRYALMRRGFLALPSSPVLAFLRTRAELETPDVQLHFIPFAIEHIKKRKLARDPGMTVAMCQLRPESRGSIHIGSPDPLMAPEIRFNFLSAAIDRETLVAGVRATRRIVQAKAMDAYRGAEVSPGPDVQSDAEIIDYIRENAQTAYHPVGTCKMGTDAMAVVDAELRVHGIEGLRVADGSIMPTLMSGNTNGPIIMIGEKASEMMLAAWR
ncbi:MAG: choline dehydrogenase [Gammaproteobacteria bacterium]|nr:choline dehydrogenase [Gammaproteobacteria bacterium]NIM73450.1 choline dehydrogenase [Gammaproteobacteria bacterium]NIN39856.1 choline dehydrogenase [Gammaproteobacteria bacterium]NIO25259.1 choline dehydrogenase [Gammaproteobacteria bacterium]NIO65886.1 choline dehydrogenase [Gammaproteobacteria bacterium]